MFREWRRDNRMCEKLPVGSFDVCMCVLRWELDGMAANERVLGIYMHAERVGEFAMTMHRCGALSLIYARVTKVASCQRQS